MKKGAFDLDDLAEQLKQMQKLGGMGGVLAMLPGIGKVKKQLDAANLDDRILKRQQAMIGSMTKAERKNPKLLNASRKKRVAAGSGTSVQDINRLVKMHRQMADMMKAMGKKRGIFSQMFGSGPAARDAGRASARRRPSPWPPSRWPPAATAWRLSRHGRHARLAARPSRDAESDFRASPDRRNDENQLGERTHVTEDQTGAGRRQEAALLPHRRRRLLGARATAATSRRSAPTIRSCRRTASA